MSQVGRHNCHRAAGSRTGRNVPRACGHNIVRLLKACHVGREESLRVSVLKAAIISCAHTMFAHRLAICSSQLRP